jgi:hypothetical protein
VQAPQSCLRDMRFGEVELIFANAMHRSASAWTRGASPTGRDIADADFTRFVEGSSQQHSWLPEANCLFR